MIYVAEEISSGRLSEKVRSQELIRSAEECLGKEKQKGSRAFTRSLAEEEDEEAIDGVIVCVRKGTMAICACKQDIMVFKTIRERNSK